LPGVKIQKTLGKKGRHARFLEKRTTRKRVMAREKSVGGRGVGGGKKKNLLEHRGKVSKTAGKE